MTNGPIYVLDSDVFMTAARTYYAFDLLPAFWQGLVRQAQDGRLLSIDRVKDEIDRGNDELTRWADRDFHQWFVSTNEGSTVAEYRLLMTWAGNHARFTDAAKAEFAEARNADAWLVAYAKARRATVVTNEKFDAHIRRKIKIPNVCQTFRRRSDTDISR